MEEEIRAKAIKWYRSPVEGKELKALYQKSDLLGFAQTLGYLGTIAATACLALYSFGHFPWPVTVLCVFLHGTGYAFMINGVHELGHDTVFKTKALNRFFDHVLAFLGLINHRMFEASHARHHRNTLHPPDDLEVVVPIKITRRDFWRHAFVNIWGPRHVFNYHWRVANGRFQGDWELKLFPESNPDRRKSATAWARTILVGHAAIIVGSVIAHVWLLPVLITLAPFYGSWLFFLCNNTQHVGLQDNATDFRLCCRTFVPNPIVRFLYWHMNYHTEHHMYPGVPCYRLGRLHKLIAADLPPVYGIAGTWREIEAIVNRQTKEPGYVFMPSLPDRVETARELTAVPS